MAMVEHSSSLSIGVGEPGALEVALAVKESEVRRRSNVSAPEGPRRQEAAAASKALRAAPTSA